MQIHYLYKEIQSFQVSQVCHSDPHWCVCVILNRELNYCKKAVMISDKVTGVKTSALQPCPPPPHSQWKGIINIYTNNKLLKRVFAEDDWSLGVLKQVGWYQNGVDECLDSLLLNGPMLWPLTSHESALWKRLTDSSGLIIWPKMAVAMAPSQWPKELKATSEVWEDDSHQLLRLKCWRSFLSSARRTFKHCWTAATSQPWSTAVFVWCWLWHSLVRSRASLTGGQPVS